ncbi:MAG: hypothetical protein ABSD98_13200 [Candidatus Korobacteraceae bacterium]|jgi:hypothetical protein
MEDRGQSSRDFRAIQYEALRAEILSIKERVIRLLMVGVTGIPLVIGAGEKFQLSAILMASPLITLVFVFMLVFEQSSLMRAGEYIKDNLELSPLCPDDLTGWEHWLQAASSRRTAEAFFAWAAYIVFVVYFAIGTYLAYGSIKDRLGPTVAIASLGLYCGGFLLALYLVVTYLRTGTSPKE